MNRIGSTALFRLRRIIEPLRSPKKQLIGSPDQTGQSASDLIATKIRSGEPLFVGRFGSGELHAVATYLRKRIHRRWPGEKSMAFIQGQLDTFWWHDGIRDSLSNGAGMFSVDDAGLDQFAERMIEDSKHVDILGSWREEENLLRNELEQSVRVELKDLEPYFHRDPWSIELKGRRVLVVHPFSHSIKAQYQKRGSLFSDNRVLPDFKLITYTPVQTIAGNQDSRFSTWLGALGWMEQEVSRLHFDIALVGAGSYGFPLSAAIKRMGKQVIHLGGATQILFGIRGRRWDEQPTFQRLFNKHWIWPSGDERPKGAEGVEGGCYW